MAAITLLGARRRRRRKASSKGCLVKSGRRKGRLKKGCKWSNGRAVRVSAPKRRKRRRSR